jgi:hypothetical protein
MGVDDQVWSSPPLKEFLASFERLNPRIGHA